MPDQKGNNFSALSLASLSKHIEKMKQEIATLQKGYSNAFGEIAAINLRIDRMDEQLGQFQEDTKTRLSEMYSQVEAASEMVEEMLSGTGEEEETQEENDEFEFVEEANEPQETDFVLEGLELDMPLPGPDTNEGGEVNATSEI